MEIDSEDVFLQNIEEYVIDENKVVTYKWLSNNLSLHINVAKRLIETFLDQQRNTRPERKFQKTFYVSGLQKGNKCFISTVVDETNLSPFKESLEKVFSEHIYSIRKGTSETDAGLLFLAGEHEDCCIGVIRSVTINKRSLDELSSLRLGAYPNSITKSIKVETQKPPSKPKGSLFSNVKDVKKEVEKDIKKEVENKSLSSISEKTSSVQPAANNKGKKNVGIAGFFPKQLVKPKIEKPSKNGKPSNNNEALQSDLSKENEYNTQNNSISNEIKKTVSPVKITNSSLNNDSKPKVSNLANNTNGVPKNKTDKKTSVKKQPTKKRKRIQTLDSDSEEEEVNKSDDDIFAPDSPEVEKPALISDDEDIIPPTPEVNTNKAPLNSRKRKKLVDKTFMDESGYIITKKVEVYESCSDKEDDAESKPTLNSIKSETKPVIHNVKPELKPASLSKKQSSPTKSKKKTSPQGQSKQQSLMNFFKKTTK